MHNYHIKETKNVIYIGYVISILTFILSIILLSISIINKNNINCFNKLNRPIIGIISWIEIETISGIIASILLFLFSISFRSNKEVKRLYSEQYDMHHYTSYNYYITQSENIIIIKYIIGSFLVLYQIFNISWIFIGSLMFLDKCFPISPKSLNNMIHTYLIYEYIIILFIICYYIWFYCKK